MLIDVSSAPLWTRCSFTANPRHPALPPRLWHAVLQVHLVDSFQGLPRPTSNQDSTVSARGAAAALAMHWHHLACLPHCPLQARR